MMNTKDNVIIIKDYDGTEEDFQNRLNQISLEKTLINTIKELDPNFDFSKINEGLFDAEEENINYGHKAWVLNQIISSMNDETAYYDTEWLYIWPDGETEKQCDEDFGDKESFKELEDTFKSIYKYNSADEEGTTPEDAEYNFHRDGLYNPTKEAVEVAHQYDKELGLEPIQVLGNVKECVDDVRFIREENEVDQEPKLDTFEDKMDFLAADEDEAIEGYDEIIPTVDDEHVKDQLTHIRDEEEAHKDYLEKVKEDPSIDYVEPEDLEKEEYPLDESYNEEERQEFNELCTKLGLLDFAKVIQYKKDNNIKDDKELLQSLRKDANKTESLNEEREEKQICCICGNAYDGYGNNAEPYKQGRCCDQCNIEFVVPDRFQRLNKKNDIKEDLESSFKQVDGNTFENEDFSIKLDDETDYTELSVHGNNDNGNVNLDLYIQVSVYSKKLNVLAFEEGYIYTLDFDFPYHWEGSYSPATRWEPEEYPDLEYDINKSYISKKNLYYYDTDNLENHIEEIESSDVYTKAENLLIHDEEIKKVVEEYITNTLAKKIVKNIDDYIPDHEDEFDSGYDEDGGIDPDFEYEYQRDLRAFHEE